METPSRLKVGSFGDFCSPQERFRIREELSRRPVDFERALAMRLITPPAVLALTPIIVEQQVEWLVLVDHAAAPACNALLIAALAHDLKLPLQVMLGWVSLLRKEAFEAT